jgi:single stranded DNA-binding protein
MNCCHFLGKLTADPQLTLIDKPDGSKTSVVDFTLSISRRFKKGDGSTGKQVSYIDLEAYDSAADLIKKNFRKHDNILVHASVRNSNYTDKETGKKIYGVKFRIESFEFLPFLEKNKEE